METSSVSSENNWSSDPICKLCDQEMETVDHLRMQCIYEQEVWLLVANWS